MEVNLEQLIQSIAVENARSSDGWGLLVSIDGVDFDYQFTADDLRKVFQRYGPLVSVDTLSPQFPFGRVTFMSRNDADSAIRDLEGKVLNGIHGRLRVVWDPYSIQKMQTDSLSPSTAATNDHRSNVRKYTCRFDIGIENEKEFQVARRIIGQKGCNMKKIVDVSGAKLRLRGKGSGYLEGPSKAESPEPLHLCVSCTSQAGYNAAVQAVSEILEGVYLDYAKFVHHKRNTDPSLQPLKVVMREMPLTEKPITSILTDESFEYPSSPEPAETATTRYDSGYWKVPT